jgi:hypothetical protein
MIEISSFGSPFSHEISSCLFIHPKKFKWVHNTKSSSDIEVYMDYSILGGTKSNNKNKFLWLCESKSITPLQNKFVKENYNVLKNIYKKIFVHDYDLVKLDDIFVYCPPAANHTWIRDRKISNKTKMVSMISSGKSFCPGHVYRNQKLEEFKKINYPIDYYGRMFNPFEKKEDVLNDYYFSITIENEKYSNYYTEKLMDCFATGTIPIYHGTPELSTMFNSDGVILLDNNFDINTLSSDLYFSKMDAIKDNFERCMNHQTSDDYIFERIKELI